MMESILFPISGALIATVVYYALLYYVDSERLKKGALLTKASLLISYFGGILTSFGVTDLLITYLEFSSFTERVWSSVPVVISGLVIITIGMFIGRKEKSATT